MKWTKTMELRNALDYDNGGLVLQQMSIDEVGNTKWDEIPVVNIMFKRSNTKGENLGTTARTQEVRGREISYLDESGHQIQLDTNSLHRHSISEEEIGNLMGIPPLMGNGNVFVKDDRNGCANYHDMSCGCGFNDCEYDKTPVIGNGDIIRDDFPLPDTITAKKLKELYPDSVWGKSKLIAMLKYGCTRGNINGTEKLSKELDAFVNKELYPNWRPSYDGVEREPDTSGEIPLVTDYKCPKCGVFWGEWTLVDRTKSVFKEEPDPHYSWVETHKCLCGFTYRFNNGT